MRTKLEQFSFIRWTTILLDISGLEIKLVEITYWDREREKEVNPTKFKLEKTD